MSIKDEILAKVSPDVRATRDAQKVADALNVGRGSVGIVSRAVFSAWATANGLRAKIEDHASNPASPLRSIALSCRDVLMGAAEGFDFAWPENVAALQAWVTAGELQQSEADALIALATSPNPATEYEVRRVAWSDKGEWQL